MSNTAMTKLEDFLAMTDLSCVRANDTLSDIEDMASIARRYGFLCAFVLPAHIPLLMTLFSQSDQVLVGGTVGFPDGGATTRIKVETAVELSYMGVDEIDMVVNIAWLKSGRMRAVGKEIQSVVRSVADIPVKVILECPHLEPAEIRVGSRIAADHGAVFVKTGTGWAGDTTREHVEIISDAINGQCRIKAAGGIRSLAAINSMRELGVERFGLGIGSAMAILTEYGAVVQGEHT